MAFGDTPAALALCLGLEMTFDKARSLDPQAADQLTRNSLANNIGGGGSREDVERMRGLKTEEGYTGTVPHVIACGGFKAKALVPSGAQEEDEIDSMGDKFLGLGYDPTKDELMLKITPLIRMNVKRSKQRRADSEPITVEMFENLPTGPRLSPSEEFSLS